MVKPSRANWSRSNPIAISDLYLYALARRTRLPRRLQNLHDAQSVRNGDDKVFALAQVLGEVDVQAELLDRFAALNLEVGSVNSAVFGAAAT